MIVGAFILFGLLAILSLYAIVVYNRLVNLKHDTAKAWSNIDVLLKQRHDELPKLVETCKQYMKHERETLDRVMQARAGVSAAREASDLPALGLAEGRLRRGLLSLFAIAEAYPELKADQSFRNLEVRISGLENAIADRREFYNEAVNNNNVRLEQFPDIVIARRFAFQAFELLHFGEEEKSDVDVRELFG
ncbi:MAG: LemA family protein [Methylococcaceae bacterium]|nr:LemA family protein [Methylococcaceae bacterium]